MKGAPVRARLIAWIACDRVDVTAAGRKRFLHIVFDDDARPVYAKVISRGCIRWPKPREMRFAGTHFARARDAPRRPLGARCARTRRTCSHSRRCCSLPSAGDAIPCIDSRLDCRPAPRSRLAALTAARRVGARSRFRRGEKRLLESCSTSSARGHSGANTKPRSVGSSRAHRGTRRRRHAGCGPRKLRPCADCCRQNWWQQREVSAG
jgi:hypothetical protein